MRKFATWVLAAGFLSAGLVIAQPPQGKGGNRGQGGQGGKGGQGGGGMGMRGGMGGGGGIQMLSNPAVVEELKITDEQKEKLKTFAEDVAGKMRERMQDLFQGGGGGGGRDPEAMKKMQDEMKKFAADTMKDLKEKKILSDEQMTRFKQITWQQAGVHGTATDEEVQKVVKLTGEQKDKLKTLTDEFNKDQRELMQAMFQGDSDARNKLASLRKEMTEKSTQVLNPDQQKAWKDLVGKEFKMPEGQGGPGGAGGGNRPRGKGKGGDTGNPPPPARLGNNSGN